MNKAEALKAAQVLLAARDKLHAADLAAAQARTEYCAAEAAYIKAVDGVEPVNAVGAAANWPRGVAVGGVMITAHEEWYEMREGTRLDFRTFERLDGGAA